MANSSVSILVMYAAIMLSTYVNVLQFFELVPDFSLQGHPPARFEFVFVHKGDFSRYVALLQ